MECSRETEIILGDRVIHTKYQGDVECDFILSAIEEWLGILNERKDIGYLIFDYSSANMDGLGAEDAKKIALSSDAVVRANPEIKLIGVMPKDSDQKITGTWAAYSASGQGPTQFSNILIMNSLGEALDYVQEREAGK